MLVTEPHLQDLSGEVPVGSIVQPYPRDHPLCIADCPESGACASIARQPRASVGQGVEGSATWLLYSVGTQGLLCSNLRSECKVGLTVHLPVSVLTVDSKFDDSIATQLLLATDTDSNS